MYVRQLMLLNDGPVTITTMKLNIQLLAVEKAFAGARMRRPTISAGYAIRVRSIHKQGSGPVTYVEPSHSEPSYGEERVEHEE